MLTKRQREMLIRMRADPHGEDGELVYERGVGYIGHDRVSGRTVFALIKLCAISSVSGNVGELERYRINETGTNLLDGIVDTNLYAAISKTLKEKP